MQRNNTPILIITIVLGVLALGATAFLMRPQGPSAQQQAAEAAPTAKPTPSPRWVALRDIPPRTRLTPAMLQRSSSSETAPPDAIGSPNDVKGLLTSETIYAGDVVTKGKFDERIGRVVPANIEVPTGLRAVAIWVDPTQTAAGLVDIGDRVDVVASHKLSVDKMPRQFVQGALQFTAGRTIGQDLLVLAVDKSINVTPTPTPVPAGAAPPPPTPVPAPTPAPMPGLMSRTRVLLAATPEIAARLIAANDQGALHITIRNPNDRDQNQVPEAREYPSKVTTAPPDKTVSAPLDKMANSFDKGIDDMTQSYRKSLGLDDPTMPQIKPADPTQGADPGTMLPPPPAEKEVTVVRGTEKTRVVVPQR